MLFRRSLLTLCLTSLFLSAVAQIEMVDPTAELRRQGTFVDTSAVELATAEQTRDWLAAQSPQPYFVFTEDRLREIRRDDALPLAWLSRLPKDRIRFHGVAQPGETFLFQVGLFASGQPINNISLFCEELTGEKKRTIPATAIQCYNLSGIDQHGEPLSRRVDVAKGKLQALWIGIDVPLDAAGAYRGKLILQGEGVLPTPVEIRLDVEGTPLPDGGVSEAWRKSRIRWINSQIGRSDEPTAPYTPLRREGNTLNYLGGMVQLSPVGLPEAITLHYDRANRLDTSVRQPVLGAPMAFVVDAGSEESFSNSTAPLRFTRETPASTAWESASQSERFAISYRGEMHFDGSICYQVRVTARKQVEVKDIRLEIPYTEYASEYIMGLNNKGGARPGQPLHWHWDTTRQQDQLWLGNVNAGLNLRLKDSNYVRPLVNIYYNFGPLRYPLSWGNNGRGGVEVIPHAGQTLVKAFSGPRTMQPGETLHFNFELMITPVKPIDPAKHLSTRFYHLNADTTSGFIPTALEYGANHINIHHKTDLYPFLNYPMADETAPDLKRFIDKAHSRGIKVSPYYTLREQTIKTPEFWILRSLGDEMIFDGPGNAARTLIHTEGPKPWLVENLRSNYLPGWYAAFEQGRFKGELDIAVIATPESRWSNYFLEGLDWMVKKLEIDGIYIDDSSLDPETMRRARRILDQSRRRLVDMHTWNHFNEHAGWANSLQLYTGLLPYVDRLWVGELFKADNPRDFWLVEMSGIPFGLMSETLDAHNLFRGLTFGMLPRLPWSGNPAPLWKLFDAFGVANADFRGYWDERSGVSSDNGQISATLYLHANPGEHPRALVALANWDNGGEQAVWLSFDPAALGFTPSRVWAPEVEGLHPSETFSLDGLSLSISLPAAGGKVLWVE